MGQDWNLLFDLGGVIFKIDWTLTNQRLQISPDIKWWEWPEYDVYERGQTDGLGFQREFEKRLNQKWPTTVFRQSLQEMIVCPLPGIDEVLESLEVPLFALSNTNEAHREAFIDAPVLKDFKKIVTSFELGLRKPEKEAFIRSLEQLQLDPSKTIYFDDRPENVEAALGVGLKAFQTVNSAETTKKVLSSFGLI